MKSISSGPRTPLSLAEEKIARDVYLRLHERWGIRPFGNISGAEQMHMDAMLALLDHDGLPDPARNLPVGQFRRTDLQALYERLVEKGLLVEELDIADCMVQPLWTTVLRVTQHRALRILANGSRRNLTSPHSVLPKRLQTVSAYHCSDELGIT